MGSNEVKVGAVTLIGIGLLAGVITFFGAFSFSDDGYKLEIAYPQVGGLMTGNVVRYAGVQVGTVKEIEVNAGNVDVIADIKRDIKIPQGAVFSLGTDGILGEKFVNIIPPEQLTGQYIQPGSKIVGNSGAGLDEFMDSSSRVLAKVEAIAEALDNVFGDPEVQKSMRDGFINARDISNNINLFSNVMANVASDNKDNLSLMITQLSQMAERMNATSLQIEQMITETNKGGAGTNFARIIENMANASGNVEKATQLLKNVATDPKTEKDLKMTISNVREASERANRMLGILNTAEVRADVLHSAKGNKWQTNLGVKLQPTEDASVYLGAYDIGDKNKLDFIFGKSAGAADLSLGVMQGEFGIGAGFNITPTLKIYSQVYDFNDTKVKVGGEIKLSDNISLLGEQMDVRKGSKGNTYVGLRSYF